MAILGDAIHARLTGHAGTTALVGTRVYPDVLPQGVTYPAVRYAQISGVRQHAMGGDTGEVTARVQVDCFALDPKAADTLGQQVRLALSRYEGTVGGVVVDHIFLDNEISDFEPSVNNPAGDPGVFRRMFDFLVWYQE